MNSLMPSRQRLQTLEAVRQSTGGGIDPDLWHVMDQRDNTLIAEEILNGPGSSKFVYEFKMADGTRPSGISVVGARHLASHYGGMKHRLVGSVQKTGPLFIFQSFPAPGMPMSVSAQSIHELAAEEDFYGVVIEVTDVKTGNTIQVEKRENRYDYRRETGERYERAHYATIAQSKAYRNGVLDLIPQDVQLRWKAEMLKLSKTDIITLDLMAERRSGILAFAAKRAIPVDRTAVEALTFDQMAGLSEAVREGGVEAFRASARVLSVLSGEGEQDETAPPPRTAAPPPAVKKAPAPRPPAAAPLAPSAPSAPPESAKPETQTEPARADSEIGEQTENRGGFFGYLLDEQGFLSGDPYANPVAYARALGAAWERSSDRPALLEHNDEWIREVLAIGGTGAAVIRDLVKLTAEAGKPPAADPPGERLQPVMVTTGRTSAPNWSKYVADIKASLGSVAAEQLGAWAEANIATIREAPDVTRLNIIKLVQDHAAAVGGAVPPVIGEAVEKPDTDRAWTENAIEHMRGIDDGNTLRLWGESTAVAVRLQRLERERPELYREVSEFARQRRDELAS